MMKKEILHEDFSTTQIEKTISPSNQVAVHRERLQVDEKPANIRRFSVKNW